MPRLLLTQDGIKRQLADIQVLHEGSIVLSLVRKGSGARQWQWEPDESFNGPVVEGEPAERNTKKITVHTSGRVNYHFSRETRYIPCLLDLTEPELIVTYVVPLIGELDEVRGERKDDATIVVIDGLRGPLTFEFFAVPLLASQLANEMGRLGVEGAYGLAWTIQAGNSIGRPEIPVEAFVTAHPKTPGFLSPAIPEEVAYLRFRKMMYAREIVASVQSSLDRDLITQEHIEAAIQRGPGLFSPNAEGVWMIVTSVPMRIAPKLTVEFDQPQFQAELVDLRPGDTRLATVRVRFKVFDTSKGTYVTTPVTIKSWELHAEL